jgi:hypothetical protein
MSAPRYTGVAILCIFFSLFFAIAFLFSDLTLTMIVGGEDSAGSWMSGVLLTISATITAIIASKRGWWPWMMFSMFFILLAVDENFMIHEAIKRHIVFTTFESTNHPDYWKGELPVIFAACNGLVVAWIMWRNVDNRVRWLVVSGVIFGTTSVTIDVLSAGVLWEDSCKLIGELCVACALAWEVSREV